MKAQNILFAIAVAALSLTACGNKQEQKREPLPPAKIAHHEAVKVPAPSPEALRGTYKGFLPSASGEGIDVTLVLNDDLTFVKTDFYKGKKGGKFTEKGKYTIDQAKNELNLVIDGTLDRYLIKNGELIMLDPEGTPPTGELADMYILKKAEESKKAKK